ncbi:hypothetical protein VNO77_24097 [Canavalia gladiata]|uniref:KIB1-4 beta-propeller domain-containing protein n=1 Tax=Canavalia gladiata TaxID=3824 RepID=A0AAN9Q9K0_CANGL
MRQSTGIPIFILLLDLLQQTVYLNLLARAFRRKRTTYSSKLVFCHKHSLATLSSCIHRRMGWQLMTGQVGPSSLRDQVLFLGANESISISVQPFSGCEPNSIYFTDRWDEMSLNCLDGGHDWGTFNVQDKSIKLLCPYAYKIAPPPIWVIPTPDTSHDKQIIKY